MTFEISEFGILSILQIEGMFESLSRTVTCTAELLALICVISRGKNLIPPCLDYCIWYCTHWFSCCLVVSSCPQVRPMCWTLTMNDT